MDEPPLSSPATVSLTGNAGGQGGAPAGANVGTGAGGMQLQASKTVEVVKWSPTIVPKIEPKLPEPYYTLVRHSVINKLSAESPGYRGILLCDIYSYKPYK
jgi:hypothetical protein